MVVVFALLLVGIPSSGAPQAAQKPQRPAIPVPESMKTRPLAEVQRYMLDKKLFTPDDRWKYEGSEQFDRQKARFGRALVYQAGTFMVGDNRFKPAGAFVKYRVWKADSVDAAHKAFVRSALPERETRFAQRTEKKLRAGDESRYVIETVVAGGNAEGQVRRIHIRYGDHLVEIAAFADLKAFGPAPKAGARPWLCEAPLNRILQATLNKWKTLSALTCAGRKQQPCAPRGSDLVP